MDEAVNVSEERIIPLKGMKGMIASKMMESLHGSAQLTHHAECDITALLRAKTSLADSPVKISIEDLLVDAVISSLRRHPSLNGSIEKGEVRVQSGINMSCAIALPGDLLVAPTILGAGTMTLAERSEARRDLVSRAKVNKLTVKEMTAGTFTVSNIGLSRVRFFTPIINSPQLAILGFGEAMPRPWVVNGNIELRPVMGLSLTFDHRAVNGAPAADFLTDLCGTIESYGTGE